MKFPVYLQHDSNDCGIACLSMITKYHGRFFDYNYLEELCDAKSNGTSLGSIKRACDKIGLKTKGLGISIEELIQLNDLPIILHWNDKHYVVLYKIKKKSKGYVFYIVDPAFGHVKFNESELSQYWRTKCRNNINVGYIMTFEITPVFYSYPKQKNRNQNVRFLWDYVNKFKNSFIKISFGIVLIAILQLIFPFLTQNIIDIGINTRNISFIYLILLAQSIVIFSSTISKSINDWIILHMSIRINFSLATNFIVKLSKLPMSFFESRRVGDTLQRIDDLNKIETFITSKSLNIGSSILSIVIFSTVLLYYSFPIFLIFFIGSLSYAFWISISLRKRKILNYKLFNQNVKGRNTTLQIVTGMQEIKLQGCIDRKQSEWEEEQIKLLSLQEDLLKIDQISNIGDLLINQIKNAIITVVSAYSVIQGEISLGMMLSIQYIIGQLIGPVNQVVKFIINLQDVKLSMERVNHIFNKQNEIDGFHNTEPTLSDKSIKIKDLSFSYSLEKNIILNKISITIPTGKTTAIVGYSGSGKTTLLKLLLGFYKIDNGTITIGNELRLDNINMDWWRDQCGIVMQDSYIFSDTILRNIVIKDEVIDYKRLYHACYISNIYDTIQSLPLKFNTIIGSDGQGLSQGQRQRLLIARAVYKDPPFIFLDEATNSLDTKNEKEIVVNLRKVFMNKTVIIIAHRLSTIKDADQIIVLNKGNVAESGDHTSLLKRKGEYYNLVKNQLI